MNAAKPKDALIYFGTLIGSVIVKIIFLAPPMALLNIRLITPEGLSMKGIVAWAIASIPFLWGTFRTLTLLRVKKYVRALGITLVVIPLPFMSAASVALVLWNYLKQQKQPADVGNHAQ